MYKFVSSLTDAAPWIEHFKKQAEATTRWRAEPAHNVIILNKDIKKQGVEDSATVNSVSAVEQSTLQAKASLAKEIDEQPEQPPKKKRKHTAKSVKAATEAAKTIFTKDVVERARKKQAPSKKKQNGKRKSSGHN